MDRQELRNLTEELRQLLEDTTILEKPVKKDNRSFKWYLRSKISKNDLDWLDGEIDWDAEYRDPNDGYTWYFPMRYAFNAEKVAEAVRRNLNRGRLECRVDIDWWEDRTDEPLLRVRFKNNKLQRETGIDNLSDEYENIVKEWQEQKNTGVKSLRDYLYGNIEQNESLDENMEHDLVCPDCGCPDIYNDKNDPCYYHCSSCGNVFHEDNAVEYCEFFGESLNEDVTNNDRIEFISVARQDLMNAAESVINKYQAYSDNWTEEKQQSYCDRIIEIMEEAQSNLSNVAKRIN